MKASNLIEWCLGAVVLIAGTCTLSVIVSLTYRVVKHIIFDMSMT